MISFKIWIILYIYVDQSEIKPSK